MAHQIEQYDDGTAAFVSARQDAWHRLGTVLPDVFTAEQAMAVAKLGGWDVRKTPLATTVLDADGVTTLDLDEHYATVRTNPVTGRPEALGVVGRGYTPVQNEEHCELLNLLVDESGAHFETAGSLRGGREVFVTMRLPETMTIGGTDKLDLYIAGLNSHDGSSAFRILVSPVRIVCANTQAMALATARASHSIRHTTGVRGRIEEARQALGLTWTYLDAFRAEAERMLATPMTSPEYREVITKIIPESTTGTERSDRHHDATLTLLAGLFDAPTQANIAGTRWAAYQAVTEWADHYAPVKTRTDKDTARAARTLAPSSTTTAVKQRAYELLKV